MLTIGAAVALDGSPVDQLQMRLLTGSVLGGNAPIVGRAACGSTWLLDESRQLVEVLPASGRIASRAVQGFAPGAQPWGLACLSDGSLWTLESPRVLARLSAAASVAERVALGLPRVALFASGDRLIFQQMPLVARAPVLASGPPRQPFQVRPWAGLDGRAAASREDELKHNIVSCGLPAGAWLPCWFADESRISVSDGTVARWIARRVE